jgi:tetratricopeptide (TPR) repeat protein
LHEGVALAGLQRYPAALATLDDAYRCFQQEENAVWGAAVAMERAAILLQQGKAAECLAVSQACIDIFQMHELLVRRAQASLLAARAALVLRDESSVRRMLDQVFAISDGNDIPMLAYQANYLLGDLCKEKGNIDQAHKAYDRAIQELERLRGNLMVEFRADFLADKQVIYEDMVELCLQRRELTQGFAYTERAKSRALLDLVAHRVDLRIQVKDASDQLAVDQLLALRQERDRLYRRWEAQSDLRHRGHTIESVAVDRVMGAEQRHILAIEKQITALWHKLLVHNADYGRDAALWQVYTEPLQSYLSDDTCLIEYFTVHGELIAFLVSRNEIEAVRLPAPVKRVLQLSQLLQLNMRTVMHSGTAQLPGLTQNAVGLLQQLYSLLIAPFESRLTGYRRLQIVPHDACTTANNICWKRMK